MGIPRNDGWPAAARYDRPMTESLSFDTHRFVKTLVDGGFSEPQAEALAEAQAAVLARNTTTGRDIERIRLEAEIHKIQADLLEWIFRALLIAQTALYAAVVLLT